MGKKIFFKIANMTHQKIIIIGLVLGFLYYQTLFDDGTQLNTQIAAVKQQVAQEQAKKKESEEALKEVEQVRAQLVSLSDQYKLISAQLPTEIQMSEVLRTIDSMAATAGIAVKTKEPQKSETKDIIEEMPIRVTAEGKFSELTLFLYNMMNTERISRVASMSVMRSPSDRGRKISKNLILEVRFANYRFVGKQNTKESEKVEKK